MTKDRHIARRARGNRVRHRIGKVCGDRPRLSVYRSACHIYAQIIDDTRGHTLAAASTLEKTIQDQIKHGGNKEAAGIVGRILAEKAGKAGVRKVVFDRGGYLYHGRVKVLAEAAREGGLEF